MLGSLFSDFEISYILGALAELCTFSILSPLLHIFAENFSGVVEYSVRCLRKGTCGHLLSFAVPIVGLGIG